MEDRFVYLNIGCQRITVDRQDHVIIIGDWSAKILPELENFEDSPDWFKLHGIYSPCSFETLMQYRKEITDEFSRIGITPLISNGWRWPTTRGKHSKMVAFKYLHNLQRQCCD